MIKKSTTVISIITSWRRNRWTVVRASCHHGLCSSVSGTRGVGQMLLKEVSADKFQPGLFQKVERDWLFCQSL